MKGNGLKKSFIIISLIAAVSMGCSGSKSRDESLSPEMKTLHELMLKGSYDDALKTAKDITGKVPVSADAPEALYLQGYILAYDKSDFQGSKAPLRKLTDTYPQSSYVLNAQKLIADCQYWQGHYSGAVDEYKKLAALGDPGLSQYAKLQIGNCYLLDDKVGNALTHYQDLIDKNPNTSIADSAQLMMVNAYLKLQNVSQAKKELKKLIDQSLNRDIQQSAQKALRQIEEEASFNKKHKSSK